MIPSIVRGETKAPPPASDPQSVLVAVAVNVGFWSSGQDAGDGVVDLKLLENSAEAKKYMSAAVFFQE